MPRKSKGESFVAPKTRRNSDEVRAERADRLARDPAFTEFFDDCYKQHLADLEAITLDGTEKSDREALSALYRFQALMDLKRTIYGPIAKQRLAKVQSTDD